MAEPESAESGRSSQHPIDVAGLVLNCNYHPIAGDVVEARMAELVDALDLKSSGQ